MSFFVDNVQRYRIIKAVSVSFFRFQYLKMSVRLDREFFIIFETGKKKKQGMIEVQMCNEFEKTYFFFTF